MIYLAIDPGETTGMCIVEWAQRVHGSYIYMLSSAPWSKAKMFIDDLSTRWTINEFIIVERSPQWKATSEQLSKVNHIINLGSLLSERADEPRLCILSPGDWKPIAKARNWKHPEAQDQHQMDAFNLFRYYFWRTLKIELPYLLIDQPRRTI